MTLTPTPNPNPTPTPNPKPDPNPKQDMVEAASGGLLLLQDAGALAADAAAARALAAALAPLPPRAAVVPISPYISLYLPISRAWCARPVLTPTLPLALPPIPTP